MSTQRFGHEATSARRRELPVRFGKIYYVNDDGTVSIDNGNRNGLIVLGDYIPAEDDPVLWVHGTRDYILGTTKRTFHRGSHARSSAVVETITFDNDGFESVPTSVIATGSLGYCLVTNVTSTTFDVDVLDSAGTSVLGVVKWAAFL